MLVNMKYKDELLDYASVDISKKFGVSDYVISKRLTKEMIHI